MIAGLTWGELDRLVDEDPIGLRDRAWKEIQQLRTENQRLRADLVAGVDEVKVSPAAQLIAALNVDTEQTYVQNGLLRAENEQLRSELAAYRESVTTGGPPPKVDAEWANVTLPPPASASDPTAPPIRSDRGSLRLSNPDPARRLTLDESQVVIEERYSGAIEKMGKS